MNESFEQLLRRISKDQTLSHGVEEATKQGAVLPILSQIGWNCFNLQEVTPEFPVGKGRIDYCLHVDQKKAVFVEVKRPWEELDNHEKQLLEYSFADGVEIAVLTNGLVWWFYLPLVGGVGKKESFLQSISENNLHTSQPNISKSSWSEAVLPMAPPYHTPSPSKKAEKRIC